MTKRFCPQCGGDLFKAIKKIPCAIKVEEDGTKKVLKESSKEYFEILQCANKDCGAKISEEDLVDSPKVKCAECDNTFNKEELIDGLCPVCYAKKNRKDIANATQEELIAMLLEAEKKANAKEKVAKKVANSETKAAEEKPKKTKSKKKEDKAQQPAKEEPVKKTAEKKEQPKAQQPVEEEVPMNIPDLEEESGEMPELPQEDNVAQEESLNELGLGDAQDNTEDLLPPSADFVDGEDLF